ARARSRGARGRRAARCRSAVTARAHAAGSAHARGSGGIVIAAASSERSGHADERCCKEFRSRFHVRSRYLLVLAQTPRMGPPVLRSEVSTARTMARTLKEANVSLAAPPSAGFDASVDARACAVLPRPVGHPSLSKVNVAPPSGGCAAALTRSAVAKNPVK